MGDLVNLRSVTKRRARAAAEVQAAANRALHGRTKAEKLAEATTRRLADAKLDQARLDLPNGSEEPR